MAGCFYGTPAHTSRRKTAFLLLGDIIDEMGFETKEKEA